ncbi:hypothetical protein GQ457_12G007900 [Hibiscus cannabinus]
MACRRMMACCWLTIYFITEQLGDSTFEFKPQKSEAFDSVGFPVSATSKTDVHFNPPAGSYLPQRRCHSALPCFQGDGM